MSDLAIITKSFLTTVDGLKTHDDFPKRMVSDMYKYSYLFDFDIFSSQEFFNAIKGQLKSELDYFMLVVTDPDPFEYFWENFNWIPTVKIDHRLEFKEYVRLLNADPGGSPADAINYNAGQIVIADNSFEKIFLFVHDQEIGVGYFSDGVAMEKIKKAQSYGIIDPKSADTIPSFLRTQVEEYGRNHSLISSSS